MRVLFAVSTDSIARSIINKYQGMYKQILSAKSVYYFDAIVKELQRDKTYDRVVISEDLEPHTDNNYERIDNNIFNKLDRITDEASNVLEGEIPIIIIGADRRTKSDPLLTKLFGIGIYNVLLGQDRSLEDVCTLINKPRTKKEAKLYYNISDVNSVTYAPESEDTVPEEQIQNILNHFNKVGKNEPVIISSFNSIADQYSSEQLKIIIKHLPLQVRAVLETSSDRYKEFVTSEQGQAKKVNNSDEGKPKKKGLFSRPQKVKNKNKYVPNQETVINNSYVPNANTNNVEVIPIEPINSALNNNENVGSVIIPKSVNINNAHSAPSYSTDNNGIMYEGTRTQETVQNTPQEINNSVNNVSNVVQQPAETNNVPQQEPVIPQGAPEETSTMPGFFIEEGTNNVPQETDNNVNNMSNVVQEPAVTPVEINSVPQEPVAPQSAPEVSDMMMPGLFDEVEENNNTPQEPAAPENAPEVSDMMMPGLFDEAEETNNTPQEPAAPQSAPEVSDMMMPGLFDEAEDTNNTPQEPVAPQNAPEVSDMMMPGLFDEAEETNNTPQEPVAPQSAPEVSDMMMPGLFDEVEETNNAPQEPAAPQSAPEVSDMMMPGLFDEAEETNNTPQEPAAPQSMPEDTDTMPGLFDGEEEKKIPEQTVETSNVDVTEPKEEILPKRGRGRPRKYPKVEVDPNAPKRGRGRPRKAVSLNIGLDNSEKNTVVSETVVLADNAEFQVNKPDVILKESIAQNLSSKYAINNFTMNNTMPQSDMFNIASSEEPQNDDEVTTENVIEDKNDNISETIPGLFDDIDANEGIADTVEIDIPENESPIDTVEEVEEEPVAEETASEPEEQSDELPGLFDDVESMEETEPAAEETASEPEEQADELPGLFDDVESMEETEPVAEETASEPEGQADELPGLFDDVESMEEEPVAEETASEPEEQADELPGLFDNIESMEEEPAAEETASEPEEQADELPGLFDNIESMEEEPAAEETASEEELPGIIGNEDAIEETESISEEVPSEPENKADELPGLVSDSNDLDNAFTVAPKQPVAQRDEIDISSVLNGTNKLVAFVGTQKNGTSFVVNNLATLISQNNVDVAILDLTRNKDSYYVFTNNDQELMKRGKKCIEKLIEGFYEGIQVQNNLTIYTSLPGEEEKFENAQAILSNLLKKYSLVILDCDFDTIPDYFKASQEIYLVQTYDILTIQPLTKFLRDSLENGIINVDKLRIVINKELKMKKLTKSLLIGGISTYNDPGLDYMKELFDPNMIMATSIPFDVDTYETYLENIVDCKISLRGYSNDFKQALAVLANMVYPLSTSRMQNNSQRITRQNDANQNDFNKMNDTLSKMRNNL